MRNKYPWQEWFDAGKFTAVRGIDFHGRTDTFLQVVRQRAIGRNVRMHITVSDDGNVVDVVIEPKYPVDIPNDLFSEVVA